ncbi:hypothetical protein G7Z17_g11432 [Cylindrodendrum hubeiense]|uniref:Ankyrin repeat protein n=1 Tax=Cylindrodendrum hubeiense TaxID=595255 RepID=A0A9P5GVW7_9HYPO|nr:hypothetical protein G7Z17_g11432 [Cylindrodendrum hubeiense]
MIQKRIHTTSLVLSRVKQAIRRGNIKLKGWYGMWGQDSHLLHLACLRGNTAIAELLIENGTEVDSLDAESHTALHYAPNTHVVRFLLQKGANVNAADDSGVTSLCSLLRWRSWALETWSTEPNVAGGGGALDPSHTVQDVSGAIRFLIQEAGANIYAQRSWDSHPLRWAISAENTEGVKLLLQAGAPTNPINPSTGQRILLLKEALANKETLEIVNMLLDAGAEVEPDEFPLKEYHTQVPIIILISFAKRSPEVQVNIAHRICKRIRDINADIGGETTLFYYLYAMRMDIAKVIIQYGAEWKHRRSEFDEATWKELLGDSYEQPEEVENQE